MAFAPPKRDAGFNPTSSTSTATVSPAVRARAIFPSNQKPPSDDGLMPLSTPRDREYEALKSEAEGHHSVLCSYAEDLKNEVVVLRRHAEAQAAQVSRVRRLQQAAASASVQRQERWEQEAQVRRQSWEQREQARLKAYKIRASRKAARDQRLQMTPRSETPRDHLRVK